MAATMVEPDIAGGVSVSNQSWATLNGLLINCVGASILPHEPEITELCETTSAMVQGSPWFTINGIPVCRMGDLSSCGHTAIASQIWFDIS